MVQNSALICGGAGFIGSHLVDRLLADGHNVEVVDDLSVGSLANLSEARAIGSGLRFHHLDILAPEFSELISIRQPSVIYHLALLPPSQTTTGEFLASASLLLTVLEAAQKHKIKKVVVALPANLVYGEVPARQLPVKEGRKPEPMGVAYVMANALIDLLTVYRESYDVEFTALAMTNVYGKRQRPSDGVVAAFAESVQTNTSPVIYGNGRQTRDFLFIDDAVDALSRAMTKGGGLVINIGTGIQTSVSDLWKLIGISTTLRESFEPARHADLQRSSVNATRARLQLGWAYWTSVKAGIAELLADLN
ncbi:MAG: UDP-glucose 4-epimerase [Actinomycetota bacterium]|jgi:UDP-glucose 4-epimerase